MSQVAVLSQQTLSQHFVESQPAHFAESQHSFSSQQVSAFFSLLHEQATAAAIAATIANDINTFFMITNKLIGLTVTKFLILSIKEVRSHVQDDFPQPVFNIQLNDINLSDQAYLLPNA